MKKYLLFLIILSFFGCDQDVAKVPEASKEKALDAKFKIVAVKAKEEADLYKGDPEDDLIFLATNFTLLAEDKFSEALANFRNYGEGVIITLCEKISEALEKNTKVAFQEVANEARTMYNGNKYDTFSLIADAFNTKADELK